MATTKSSLEEIIGSRMGASKSLDDVYQEVENCCVALSERLDDQQYFFNNKFVANSFIK